MNKHKRWLFRAQRNIKQAQMRYKTNNLDYKINGDV